MANTTKDTTRQKNLTRQQLASLWGVNAQQFDRKYRQYIPDRLVVAEGTGRRALFRPESVRAIHDGLIAEEREKAQLHNDDALLVGGSDSPAMERLRLAKAQLAELDLARKQGDLIPADTVSQGLAVVASRYRRLGERLAKKYGRDVGDAIDKMLDDALEDLEQTLDTGD